MLFREKKTAIFVVDRRKIDFMSVHPSVNSPGVCQSNLARSARSQNDNNEFSNQKLASYNFFENSFMKNKVLWKKKFFLWKNKSIEKKDFSMKK